jgi:hypothetical protein
MWEPLFENTLPNITNIDANLSNESNEELDKVMEVVKDIGESERHFNGLEVEYRKLASTWLLAALGACGYILLQPDVHAPFDKWFIVIGICIAASLGIGVLWIMDLKVYHRLLRSFFTEGVRLEVHNYKWLPAIIVNMIKLRKRIL